MSKTNLNNGKPEGVTQTAQNLLDVLSLSPKDTGFPRKKIFVMYENTNTLVEMSCSDPTLKAEEITNGEIKKIKILKDHEFVNECLNSGYSLNVYLNVDNVAKTDDKITAVLKFVDANGGLVDSVLLGGSLVFVKHTAFGTPDDFNDKNVDKLKSLVVTESVDLPSGLKKDLPVITFKIQ